jgi:taurine--2-oxoglutarate transaminase
MEQNHPSIGLVRGIGVFWAIELVKNRATREPMDAETMGRVAADCKARGMWPMVVANRITVVPPCNTPDDLAREGLAILDEALSIADSATA